MIANLILAISGIVLLLLALVVYLNNPKKAVNRTLAAFLASGFLWLSTNLLTNISISAHNSLLWARTTLFGAVLIALLFLVFVAAYTGHHRLSRGYLSLISLPAIAISLFTYTPHNISYIESQGKNAETGALYPFLLLYILVYFGYGVYLLLHFYKKASSTEKSQLQYIFAGLMLTFVPALITNGILPAVGSSDASSYGPIAVLGVSVFTAIAIIRHGFLDIRPIIARTIAYLLLFGTLSVIFAASLFTITSIFFEDQPLSTGARGLYLGSAILLALLLPPLKRFFDRFTNRLFYRDAYDPQEMLNRLNTSLVTSTNLDMIVKKSASIIKSTLNAEYCSFALRDAQHQSLRLKGDRVTDIDPKIVMDIAAATSHMPKKIILTDELQKSKHTLVEKLQTARISVFIKLRGTAGGHLQIPGYILLGQKKSGGLYSEQDIRVLEIIADELVIAIQNSLRFEEIQQFNITLQQKIEDATSELRKANIRLKELDKTKDEFISMASHQLRTPLTAVKGYLSMVLEGDTGKIKSDQKELLQRAFDGADRMVYLISDLLNVSRLQSGKFVIENKPTDLVNMVSAQVDQLQESAANHQLKLAFHKPSNFPKQLMLDETKTQQVIMNFMDNAIYYTPAGGSVNVALSATDKEITYTVTDTGLGVPKSEQPHLFTKFYRAGNARKMRPDGTGLGLFMAKKVIVAQGGAIIFKSEEGKGSTFGFSFPRHAVEPKA